MSKTKQVSAVVWPGLVYRSGVAPLPHDVMTAERFGTAYASLHAEAKIERRIVHGLISHLKRAGFELFRTFDGEQFEQVDNRESAMGFVFNLDEVSLRFVPKGQRKSDLEHGVLLVLGNGTDVLTDWNFDANDADGFNAAMESFDSDAYV